MYTFLAFATATILIISSFALLIYACVKKNKDSLIVLIINLVVSTLFGIALIIQHQDFSKFSFLHISNFLFFLVLPFVLFLYCKTEKSKKIVTYVLTGCFLLFFIVKLFFDIPIYQKLPLNVCNIVCVFILIRFFIKPKWMDSYIVTFGILGYVMNLLLGQWFSNIAFDMKLSTTVQIDFFFIRTFESNQIHNLYITYVVYLLLTKQIKPDLKESLKNLFWIIPVYFILVFTNQIYEFNFFFTSEFVNPVLILYELFYNLAGFKIGQFKINLLYDVVIITSSVLAIVLVNYLLSLIFKEKKGALENEKIIS
jgi:hypothetical protein